MVETLRQSAVAGERVKLDSGTIKGAYERLSKWFDERYGGFSWVPKFPTPHNLLFLLGYWKRTGEERSLMMVEKTLQAMRMGGIYDQMGARVSPPTYVLRESLGLPYVLYLHVNSVGSPPVLNEFMSFCEGRTSARWVLIRTMHRIIYAEDRSQRSEGL
jgi:hypothetical protein